MPHIHGIRVGDMLAAINSVAEDIGDLSFEEFAGDPRRLRSVAFSLMVLGEAAAGLPDEVRAAAPEVPWPLLRGMRNRIVHEYFHLDPEIVWDTATVDLPALEGPLQSLLSTL